MLKRLLLVVLLAFAGLAQATVYSLPWGPKPQFVDANGAPMSGGFLLTFAGGSSTPQVTYTDQTGGTSNPTTITLNTRGETPNEVWLTGGQTYKFVLKDSAGATIWTVDSVSGVNDTTGSQSEWIAGPAPTFVSATSFTLVGDQTVEFHKGRRLRTTNSGGTVYSTITASSFGVSTTVTVANDSSVLDSGLSAVSYGIIRAANPSISSDMVARKGTAVVSAATTDIWSIAGDFVHVTGTTTITSFGTAPYAGAQRVVIFDGVLTLTQNATSLILPGAANIFTAAGDRAIVRADTTANMVVVSYERASGAPAVGTGVPRSYLAGLTMSTAGSSATMSVAAGMAADSTNSVMMSLASSISKTTSSWAVGTGNGGKLSAAALASGTYHFYEIVRVDTGVVDVGFDTSPTSPTMPTNYTLFRRIGSAKNDGTNWVAFTQTADRFIWSTAVNDSGSANPGTSAVTQTLSGVPTGIKAVALLDCSGANFNGRVSDLSGDDVAAATAPNFGTASGGIGGSHVEVLTNTSSQVRVRISASGAGQTAVVYTSGWIDTRGKE